MSSDLIHEVVHALQVKLDVNTCRMELFDGRRAEQKRVRVLQHDPIELSVVGVRPELIQLALLVCKAFEDRVTISWIPASSTVMVLSSIMVDTGKQDADAGVLGNNRGVNET